MTHQIVMTLSDLTRSFIQATATFSTLIFRTAVQQLTRLQLTERVARFLCDN